MKRDILLLVCVSLNLIAYSGDYTHGMFGQKKESFPTVAETSMPSQVLNLTNWKLNVPVAGSNGWSQEIKQPELATYQHSEYFHVSSNGNAVVFKAPVEGITTSGSKYPRSELREMTNGGRAKADWDIAAGSGIHTMEITQAVTHLPDHKPHVVVGQIHDADNDVIVFRLEGKKLWIDHNGTKSTLLTDQYELGTKFTVKFVAGNGKVDSYYNGQFAESYATNAEHCFFKAGMYTQSNLTKGDVAGAYGEVEIYNVTITHDDDVPAGVISQVTFGNSQSTNDNNVYDLSGRKIVNCKLPNCRLPKAVNIRQGKKIVIKQ